MLCYANYMSKPATSNDSMFAFSYAIRREVVNACKILFELLVHESLLVRGGGLLDLELL